MIKRTFETGYIIGLFGLVSGAIAHYLPGVPGLVAYGVITVGTGLFLHLQDKKNS